MRFFYLDASALAKRYASERGTALIDQIFAGDGPERLHVVIEADNVLVVTALPLIDKHSLNATDAILLRSAMNLAAGHRVGGNSLVVVACDQRLLRAAQAEGLETFDPETQTQAELTNLLGK